MAKKSKYADRGVSAEKATQDYLEAWQAASVHREFNRLPDTKAAGRVIKAAVADFEFYTMTGGGAERYFGLIEVKETKHDYRLDVKRITQMARLRKRAKCGGRCFVLIYHSTLNRWRSMPAPLLHEMASGGAASWDLRGIEDFATAGDALHDLLPEAFDPCPPK